MSGRLEGKVVAIGWRASGLVHTARRFAAEGARSCWDIQLDAGQAIAAEIGDACLWECNVTSEDHVSAW